MDRPDPWLPHALRYVESWLAFQMRQSEQPGCAIAIAVGGELVFERAFGMANLETGVELTPRHRFRVASHSKTFTAVAIMLLREQGRVRLDDVVGSYVSGLSDQVAAVTINHLLCHTAGLLRDGVDCAHWDDMRPFFNQAALRRELSRLPVLGPSERMKYSNVGFGLLGLVIDAVTGEPFETWIAREVISKVGLKETSPDLPATDASPLASGHTGRLPAGRTSIPGTNPTRALAAATGFVSTAGDLALFFSQLDPAAPSSILSATSRREMTHRQWNGMHSKSEVYYGLGTISGSVSDRDCFGHNGGFYGYSSCTRVVPELGITASVVVNAVDGPASDWIEGAIHICDRFAKAGPPRDFATSWSGRWWSAWGTVDLVPMSDKVLIASPGSIAPFEDAQEIAVTSDENGTITAATAFGSYGEPVACSFDGDGKPTSLLIAGEEHLPEETFLRLRREAVAALEDIVTPRLVLHLIDRDARSACLARDLASAERLLDATVPDELLEDPSGFRFDQLRTDEDPRYRPWATRVIVLKGERLVIGHLRFHSRPGPTELRSDGPSVVELGFRVFSPHRRQGYATEAVTALMGWASSRFGVDRFTVSVAPENIPSLGLIARLGFVKVGQTVDKVDGIEDIFCLRFRPVSPSD